MTTATPTPSPATVVRAPRRADRRFRTVVTGTSAALVLALTLAACGSSNASTNSSAAAPATSDQAGNGNSGTANGNGGTGSGRTGQNVFRPAASGLIAEVDSGSMQVQSSTAQTTVNWSSSTTFTSSGKGTVADVKAGVCLTAVAAASSTTSGAAPSAAAPSAGGRATRKVTELTASTVVISPATNGTCSTTAGLGGGGFGGGGFGGGNGGGNGGAGNGGAAPSAGAMPTGAMPTDAAGPGGAGGNGGVPSGAANRGFGNFGERVSGVVTSVSGKTVSLTVTSGAQGSQEKYTSTVTLTDATGYTTVKAAAASAVKVGLCAVVTGTADTTGAVAAKTVALSTATNGTCTTATTGRSGRGNGGGANGTAPTTNG